MSKPNKVTLFLGDEQAQMLDAMARKNGLSNRQDQMRMMIAETYRKMFPLYITNATATPETVGYTRQEVQLAAQKKKDEVKDVWCKLIGGEPDPVNRVCHMPPFVVLGFDDVDPVTKEMRVYQGRQDGTKKGLPMDYDNEAFILPKTRVDSREALDAFMRSILRIQAGASPSQEQYLSLLQNCLEPEKYGFNQELVVDGLIEQLRIAIS